jgi:hypothetical protein
MKKTHVKVLRYSVVPGPGIDYHKAAPTTEDTDNFTVNIQEGIASFEMKGRYATVKEARQAVDPYVHAWEVLGGLEQDPGDLNFDFQNAEVSDNSAPEADLHVHRVTGEIIAHMEMSGTLHVSRGKYPTPPKCFSFSPDVETMYNRYKAYREGREPLLSMAYMCLTVLEASARGRANTSKQYCIDRNVLDTLGELSSTKGDATEVRKFPKDRKPKALTTHEKQWLNEVIKALIRRAGEWAYDSNAQLTPIRMNDFPTL